jgi:hypothetical protein
LTGEERSGSLAWLRDLLAAITAGVVGALAEAVHERAASGVSIAGLDLCAAALRHAGVAGRRCGRRPRTRRRRLGIADADDLPAAGENGGDDERHNDLRPRAHRF